MKTRASQIAVALGLAAAAFSFATTANKLPVYSSTGLIELQLGKEKIVFESKSNTIPNQPGRMVHSANWRIMPPYMVAGMNLAPEGVLVHIVANNQQTKQARYPSLHFSFSIDEKTLELIESRQPTITLERSEGDSKTQYESQNQQVQIEQARFDDQQVLHISGSFSGELVLSETQTQPFTGVFSNQLPKHGQ